MIGYGILYFGFYYRLLFFVGYKMKMILMGFYFIGLGKSYEELEMEQKLKLRLLDSSLEKGNLFLREKIDGFYEFYGIYYWLGKQSYYEVFLFRVSSMEYLLVIKYKIKFFDMKKLVLWVYFVEILQFELLYLEMEVLEVYVCDMFFFFLGQKFVLGNYICFY